jgi:hypothetical protein
MADELASRVRIAESIAALDRLECDVRRWIGLRRARDTLLQYATPLTTLEWTLLGAVASLQDEAGALPPRLALGDLHARAANLDERAALVRKVWAWFQAKFDQRDRTDDQRLTAVLAAADEVVWSCWKEAFESAALSGGPVAERGPAPLPYIDPEGGAEAFVRDEPPPGLGASDADQALGRFLVRLPVPVVRLPVGCLDSPWWLAMLPHEVGHHLQYDLLPDAALVAEVGEVVAGAVGGDRAEAARWRGWSRELFADACALLALGPAAINVTLQVELGGEAALLNHARGHYPAPAVRLALLAAEAERLGLDPRPALGGFGDPAALAASPHVAGAGPATDPLAARRERVRGDLAHVPKVAAALLEAPLGGLGPLPRLFRFEAAHHGPAGRYARWADTIERGAARPTPTLRAAREAVAGAVLAWRKLATIADDGERDRALAVLAEDLPPLLAASRSAGSRAGDGEGAPKDLGAELAALVRDAVPAGDTPVGR